MFELDYDNVENQVDSGIFGVSKGNRFDGKNHHCLLFDGYMSLSYSYMSFVIKAAIEKNDGPIDDH